MGERGCCPLHGAVTTPPSSCATPASPDRPDGAAGLAVQVADGQCAAIAARPFAPGDAIVQLTGSRVAVPSRYSVQIDEGTHLEPVVVGDLADPRVGCAWRFLNHSCDPNAAFDGTVLRALRPIAAGEQVTFHYAATEYVMAVPFVCGCGAPDCLGQVSGYRDLGPDARRRLAAQVRPHVLALARRDEGAAVSDPGDPVS